MTEIENYVLFVDILEFREKGTNAINDKALKIFQKIYCKLKSSMLQYRIETENMKHETKTNLDS